MAFKQERPGVWYNRAAQGGDIFKVVRPPQGTGLLAAPRYAIDEPIIEPDDMDPLPIKMPNAEQVAALLTDVRTVEEEASFVD